MGEVKIMGTTDEIMKTLRGQILPRGSALIAAIALSIRRAVAVPSPIYLLPLTLLLSVPCGAVEIHPNAGTTSATFLKLGIGSRAVGMAGAYTALADDMTALYWNPAGLAQLRRQEMHLTHNESFEDLRHDFAGYARPLANGDVIAGALYGFYTPKDIERRSGLNEDDPFEPITGIEGLFQSYDIAGHAAWARFIKPGIAVGAGLKVLQQTIDDTSAYAAAADLGALYLSPSLPLSIGFAAQHMGTPVKFINKAYDLPFTLRLGGAWRWNRRLTTTVDLSKSIDNYPFAAAGAEYAPIEMMRLRAGYRYRWNGLELGDLSGFSGGIGFNVNMSGSDVRFDYAFMPYGVLGNAHRFSISVCFGAAARTAEPGMPAAERVQERQQTPQLVSNPVVPAKTIEQQTAPLETPGEEYTYVPLRVSSRLRSAGGRHVVYTFKAESAGRSEILEVTALMHVPAPADIAMKFGEKAGTGTVYKHFAFKRNFPAALYAVRGQLRLPADVKPYLVTETGKPVKFVKSKDEGATILYSFTLPGLQPFRVERR